MIIELEAFPRSVEVYEKVENRSEKKKWWGKMLGRASTVTGSVQDIMEQQLANNPYVKNGLTYFKEGINLFRGQ